MVLTSDFSTSCISSCFSQLLLKFIRFNMEHKRDATTADLPWPATLPRQAPPKPALPLPPGTTSQLASSASSAASSSMGNAPASMAIEPIRPPLRTPRILQPWDHHFRHQMRHGIRHSRLVTLLNAQSIKFISRSSPSTMIEGNFGSQR